MQSYYHFLTPISTFLRISVMVSSLLPPTFGTLSLPLYFRLPSTFLPSKGRSITTLGARWHDFFFFITLFRCFFINSFKIFYKIVLLHFFSFFQGMQTRERAHCARSVFPFIKKKKKKISSPGRQTTKARDLSFFSHES